MRIRFRKGMVTTDDRLWTPSYAGFFRSQKAIYNVGGKNVSKKEYNAWRRKNILFKSPSFNFKEQAYKEFRSDIEIWEEKIKLFGFIDYYRYGGWRDGKSKEFITLWRYRKKTAKIFKVVPLPAHTLTRQEFEEKYDGNRWLVPTNRVPDFEFTKEDGYKPT